MWANLSSTVAKLQDGLNLEEQLVRLLQGHSIVVPSKSRHPIYIRVPTLHTGIKLCII